jgi:hypothetical protein
LLSNINGLENTANGLQALFSNTTGNLNTACGAGALFHNTTGSYNMANGADALFHNTGVNNTADGFQALYRNTTGSTNIALGFSAGSRLTTGINNIDIGNVGVAAESNVIRIGTEGTQGAAYIAGISEEVVGANNLPVLIDSTGKLGTRVMSSRQFKKEIKPMNNASEAILALKPVTFRYKDDKTNTPQFGLIAEEVGKVDPDLVVRDKNGEIFTVRYEAVNAMLLNEFLREHQTVQELKKEVAALTAGLEKVSAQLEISKPATQTVLNNR